MKVMTVCGEMSPDDLGITMVHEHLLIDCSSKRIMPQDPYLRSIADRPVDFSILSELRLAPMISKDSMRLTDVDVAIEELEYFTAAGGQTLVDQTSRWIGGDPAVLKQISQNTGINIINCTAYYSPNLPADIDDVSVDELAERLLREVTEGFEGTDIKPGLIGEIGTTWPFTPQEEKILRAAARAQVKTGMALSIHPYPWGHNGLELLDIVESEGVDPSRVVMCHLDHILAVDYHKALAARGVFIEYDRFGNERYGGDPENNLRMIPRDVERIEAIKQLIAAGYLSQILISQDVCMKIELKKFGGEGYGHILRLVVPMMKRMGIGEEDIDTMLRTNPKRMLAF